jgi:hypothetical protein
VYASLTPRAQRKMTEMVELKLRSVFCLEPPGDTYSRKGNRGKVKIKVN